MPRLTPAVACLLLVLPAAAAFAAAPTPGPPMTIQHVSGAIALDGDLNDPGWQGVTPITQWFETNVGDNVEPAVKNVARLAYDDKFLYAGFEFEDPHPELIRRPLGDHDAVNGSTDYAGVIVDSRNDGKTAQMFLANPSGVEYDAMSSDVSGEDNSPDFFWDAAGKVTDHGWNLEIRIPFSSLRYSGEAAPTWGMLLYRNYPRDRRYQFFSARLPRDVNCFICNSSKMTGLASLPHGSHLVIAPFGTAGKNDFPDSLGAPLSDEKIKLHGGLDVKWSPIADFAIDGTYKPDFSQVESDVAQIAANERFAIFFPEKRPFFLEGIDLFSTPMRAVYTRTITSPEGGLRGTGRLGGTSVTALYAHDRGGGLVIVPGPQFSRFVPSDLESDVGILRVRRDLGQSFVSALGTVRTFDGGHSALFGPDFQWRPNNKDNVTGQLLWSDVQNPSSILGGAGQKDHAALLSYAHNTRQFDFFTQGQDIGGDFRADDGFIPQVGYREIYLESGWTVRPKNSFFSRLRFFTINWFDALPDNGARLSRRISVGTGMDGKVNSFIRVEFNDEDFLVRDRLSPASAPIDRDVHRFRPRILLQATPSRLFSNLSLDTYLGQDVDFFRGREGTGVTMIASGTIRPNRHLELRNDASRSRLDFDDIGDGEERLTDWVGRVRGTYAFDARSFVRLIGQYTQTTRSKTTGDSKEAAFNGSGLFAYKLNWQTVFYLGYGDERDFDPVTDRMQKANRQLFAKLSYAWQP